MEGDKDVGVAEIIGGWGVWYWRQKVRVCEGGKEKLGVDFCLTPLLFLFKMRVGPWLVWAWVIFWMG